MEQTMRYVLTAAVAALAISTLPAFADQNFIPLGQDYSIGKDGLPPLNSEQEQFNAQVDVYQSEVYNRNLSQKIFNSRAYNLTNEQNPSDLDDDRLDY